MTFFIKPTNYQISSKFQILQIIWKNKLDQKIHFQLFTTISRLKLNTKLHICIVLYSQALWMHAPSPKQARMNMKIIITVVKHVFHSKFFFAILAKRLTKMLVIMSDMVHTSMTSLLMHTVAHSTRSSFRLKTNNRPLKKFLSLWSVE